ncbi:extracellular solute-binding protein [Methanomethylophilus alvi]|uniref:extracellular solute-binding protein n=1 Tax=Methanomethylophilus alvi TaxID=1291540 RepID=UPI002A564DA8|nr:extracellular solute-binding protein [Methanomethylophilus alvi]MDD7479647.1 extracellular solute-binding protein [Methanomethylophilus alvi]
MDDKTMKIAAVAAIAIIAIAGVAVFMMNSDDGKDDAKFEIMNVEGVDATVDNVVNGSYTLQRGLILATKGTASGAVADLISYVLSAEGQAIVEDNDYIAVDSSAPAYKSTIDDKTSYSITIQGSTTVNPIMMAVEEEYEKIHPNVRISITANGSGTGAAAAIDGTADIGMLSRDLKTSETDAGLVPTVIGKDGIAIIVNKSVTGIDNLTLAQIAKIYDGTYTNWNQLGGVDHAIDVCGRESSSGTRGAFEELLSGKVAGFSSSSVTDKMVEFASNNALLTHIETTDYSIGYVSLGIALEAL